MLKNNDTENGNEMKILRLYHDPTFIECLNLQYRSSLPHVLPFINIHHDYVNAFIEELKILYGRDKFHVYYYPHDKNDMKENVKVIVANDFVLAIQYFDETKKENHAYIISWIKSLELTSELAEIVNKFSPGLIYKNMGFLTYKYVSQSQGRPKLTDIAINEKKDSIPIASMYPYLDVDKLYLSFKTSPSSILLLTGDTGIGKTSLLKILIKKFLLDSDFEFSGDPFYINDENLLRDDNFWTTIITEKPSLIILDDVKKLIETNRKLTLDDIDYLSTLLSNTSGMLNIESKILMSTNLNIKKIDTALIRPGRCFDILELRPLHYHEAETIWTETYKLNPSYFTNNFKDKQKITAAELDVYKNELIGYMKKSKDNHSYLKEPLISKLEDYRKGLIKTGFGN